MRKSRFTVEQMMAIVKQAESGLKAVEICRQHGISEATFYLWKSRLSTSDCGSAVRQRLEHLEDENSKLKRIVADLTLDNTRLKDRLARYS